MARAASIGWVPGSDPIPVATPGCHGYPLPEFTALFSATLSSLGLVRQVVLEGRRRDMPVARRLGSPVPVKPAGHLP